MSTSKDFERGLTLVELMVAMAISLFIGIAVMVLQGQMLRTSLFVSDVAVRQNEARTALDVLTREVSSAGFGLDWNASGCDLTMAYGNGQPVALYPIWAQDATAQTILPLTSTQLGYPSGALPTQALFVQTSSALTTGQAGGTFQLSPFFPANMDSALSSTILPLPLTAQADKTLSAGDVALVRTSQSGANVCYQVPISSVSTTLTGINVSSLPSANMPPNGYAGFNGAIRAQGVSPTVSSSSLLNSTLTSLGAAGGGTRLLRAFYVGMMGSIPTLYEAQIDTTNSSLVSQQPLAAGVVSLQVRFTPPGGGTPVAWSSIVSAGQTGQVQAASIALVTRTLHPDYGYTAPASIAVPGFSSYPVPAQDRHYHYAVLQTNLALRNLLWRQQ